MLLSLSCYACLPPKKDMRKAYITCLLLCIKGLYTCCSISLRFKLKHPCTLHDRLKLEQIQQYSFAFPILYVPYSLRQRLIRRLAKLSRALNQPAPRPPSWTHRDVNSCVIPSLVVGAPQSMSQESQGKGLVASQSLGLILSSAPLALAEQARCFKHGAPTLLSSLGAV